MPQDFPPLEKFHAENIRSLSGICRRVLEGAQTVIAYVDENRETAKARGVEALGAELTGIIEGGRLQELQDHLDYALAQNKSANLTLENLSRLNRAERLLSEGNRALSISAGQPIHTTHGPSMSGSSGIAQAQSGPDNTVLIIAVIGLSVIGIAASVLAVLALTRD